jgi:hypothetical protein
VEEQETYLLHPQHKVLMEKDQIGHLQVIHLSVELLEEQVELEEPEHLEFLHQEQEALELQVILQEVQLQEQGELVELQEQVQMMEQAEQVKLDFQILVVVVEIDQQPEEHKMVYQEEVELFI